MLALGAEAGRACGYEQGKERQKQRQSGVCGHVLSAVGWQARAYLRHWGKRSEAEQK